MHINDADSELLKNWIITKLEHISDADGDVLADYVLALINTDDPTPVVKTNCIENLRDFLPDSAEAFVNDVFVAIATKSYDPAVSSLQPAPSSRAITNGSEARSERQPSGAKKRPYNEVESELGGGSNIPTNGSTERQFKLPKKGGRGFEQRGVKHHQTTSHRHSPYSKHLPHVSQQSVGSVPALPTGFPNIDPNDPIGSLMAINRALGMISGMTGMNPVEAGSAQNMQMFPGLQNRQRCIDYDKRGFCTAGASCPYEHGENPYVVPTIDQEYDPGNAALPNIIPNRVGHVDAWGKDRARGRTRGRGRNGISGRGSARRSEISLAGPARDFLTALVVEQIPDEKCNEKSVRDFFGEFGNIQDINVQPEMNLAVIKYETHGAARAAYESPKVVFENRFVKVFWQRQQKRADPTDGLGSSRLSKPIVGEGEMEVDHIDPAEFAKRQEDAQLRHEEAKKQREEAERQKHDLNNQLKAMEEERKKISILLAKKTGEDTSISARQHGDENDGNMRALKEQLASLEAEAKSLGIDPEVPATNGGGRYPGTRGRGSSRGHGRGRGFYSGFRGGRAGGSTGAVMRLDNRPKTISIIFGDDSSYESYEEKVRQFMLFNKLSYASVTRHPKRNDAALIEFGQRFEGENFMALTKNGLDLPQIGSVELAWYKSEPAVFHSSSEEQQKVTNVRGDDSTAEREEQQVFSQHQNSEIKAYETTEDENLDLF